MMALSTSRTRRVARALLLTAATLKAAAAATFSPGSLALLGVGDGATSLGSTVVQGAVYEVEPVNGTTVQTIALPTTSSTGVNQCNFYGVSNTEGKLSLTVSGERLVIPCYNAPVGTSFSSIASFTAAVVAYDGGVDTSTTAASASSAQFRGLASLDGSYFYAGMSAGLRGFAYGSTAATTTMTTLTSTTSANLYTVGFGAGGGGLYASWGNSPYGVVRPFASAPYPTTAGTALVSTTALSGTSSAGSLTVGFHFQDAFTLFTCAYATSGTLGHLQKYTLSGSTWSQPSGWPKLTLGYSVPAGGSVTPTGIKSIAGGLDAASGAYMLYLVTSTASTGGNALLRFNTATEMVALVATAPAYVNWAGVAWAPAAPSSTPSLTASPSFGASPSTTATPSLTATPSRTPSQTPTATPTATGTTLCAAPTASPAPFGSGHLAVLRVGAGSGRDLVGTAAIAREAFIDEYTATGTLVQIIALPIGPAVTNASGGLASAGCTINAAFLNNGMLSRSVDGRSLALACLPLSPGAVPAAGVSKTVVSVGADGVVTPIALMNSYLNTAGGLVSDGGGTSVTGAVTPDGFNYWLGTSSGTFWTQAGRVGAGQSTSSTAAGGLAMAGGYVFRVGSATGAVSILGSQAAGYTVPNNITGTFASGASSGSANSAGLWMEDFRTMWLLDAGTASSTPTISKFTRSSDSTPFAAASGYPVSGFSVTVNGVPTTVYDGRGLTGMLDPADGVTLRLYFTSSVGLVRYTPADGSFTLLAQPCDKSGTMRFQGIAVAPYVSPSPTQSPTAQSSTPSLTPSPSVSMSAPAAPFISASSSVTAAVTSSPSAAASASAAATGTGTPSSSHTGTPSSSVTGTTTAASTGTASVSGTPPATASVSGTPPATGTASVSGTPPATGTASVSGTPPPTATASVSVTPPSTGTASVSGTPPATASVSGTPPATGTASISVTPPSTGTASVSGTPPATGTASGSNTGSPSASATGTGTGTAAATQTGTPSPSGTGSVSATPPVTGTPAATSSPTPAVTRSGTPASTPSRAPSGSPTKSRLPSPSRTRSASPTPTGTRTRSRTRTATRSASITKTRTPTKKKALLRRA